MIIETLLLQEKKFFLYYNGRLPEINVHVKWKKSMSKIYEKKYAQLESKQIDNANTTKIQTAVQR